jgi:glutamine amidotransferase PdxT
LPGCGGEEAQRLPETQLARAPIVAVLNGCGVPGSARKVADALRQVGFDVGNGYGENADSFEYPTTLVVDYVGRAVEARKVADFLRAPMVQQISHDPDRFGTIGVIVGADFQAHLAQTTGK